MPKNLTITVQRIEPAAKKSALQTVQKRPGSVDIWSAWAATDKALALKSQYIDIDDCIETELSTIDAALKNPNETEKQRLVYQRRKLTLLKQRATNTSRIQKIDCIIENNYAILNNR